MLLKKLPKTLTNYKQLFPELKGKVLFVFSDPGGAKPVLALAEEHKNSLVISDRTHAFYSDFDVEVKIVESDYEKIIIDFSPDLIFTATSYRSDIEREFHLLAKKLNIPCYAFVDHWTAMAKRFQNKDGDLLIPQQVWVIDERAKELAMEQGIPESVLVIKGNPYYEWLKNWKPVVNKSDFLKSAGVNNNRHLLVFAPDPLSNVDGLKLYGFDEITATHELVELFVRHQQELTDWQLLIKPHPNQNMDKLKAAITKDSSVMILPENIDTNTTLYYADVVMGFFSNILIEATILQKPVLRYLPNEKIEDSIKELNIGTVVNRENVFHHLVQKHVWN